MLDRTDDVMDENEEFWLNFAPNKLSYRFFQFPFYAKLKHPPPFPLIGSKFNFTIMNPKRVLNV